MCPLPVPYCGVGCGLNLVVSEGKLVGVEPYKRSPINEGKLCPKGMTCWEHVQQPRPADKTEDQEERQVR